MPAEMYETDEMYYVTVDPVRDAPWHINMGTNVNLIDMMPVTREERMRLSGQFWQVIETDVYERQTADAVLALGVTPVFVKVPDWKLLKRSDNMDTLHVARGTYEVLQNEVGHEMFEMLSADARLADGTGGTVKRGAVCYLSARIDEPQFIVGDNSPIFPQLVVTWTHNGEGALTARITTIRPVCWNTLSAGEAESERSGRYYTFRHTKRALERIEDAKRILMGAREETARFVELANELAAISVSDEQREQFIQTFIPEPATHVVISDRVLDNINEARAKVRGIFDSATIPEQHRNTAYGLVTAGVEYLDHLRGYRNSDTYLGRTLLRDEPLKARLVPMVRELLEV